MLQNKEYVPQVINKKTMKHLVSRIQALNYLYFTKDELDPEMSIDVSYMKSSAMMERAYNGSLR
jgi:hypothetical protein